MEKLYQTNRERVSELLAKLSSNRRAYKSAGDWTTVEELGEALGEFLDELDDRLAVVKREDVRRLIQLTGSVPGGYGLAAQPPQIADGYNGAEPRGIARAAELELELAVDYLGLEVANVRRLLENADAERLELGNYRRDVAAMRRVLGIEAGQ